MTGNVLILNKSILKNSVLAGQINDVKSSLFARQLTLFDSKLLQDVDIYESVYSKERPTLDFYCSVIDKMGRWVTHAIKIDTGNEIERMEYFVKVAMKCYQLHSFNMSYLIYTGVTHSSLNSTFQKLSRKSLKMIDELKKLFDLSLNYYNYRKMYAVSSTPKIPILPIWLGDLIHSETSYMNNKTENGLLRMDALRTFTDVLVMINHSQRVPYEEKDLICSHIFETLSKEF